MTAVCLLVYLRGTGQAAHFPPPLPFAVALCSFVTCAAQQVLDITREMVSHARSHVDDVEFSAEDALRSDYEFLSEVNLHNIFTWNNVASIIM